MKAARLSPPESAVVELSLLRRDGGTQPRAAIDHDVVADYVASYQEGRELPAVVAFYDGTDYWLADGFHRAAALGRLQRVEVIARVYQGTRRDAVLYSCGANAEHGLRRSPADKRRAVTVLLEDEEWSRRSDRWIAERARVSHPFVGRLRAELSGGNVSTSRVGSDGKEYPVTSPRSSERSDPAPGSPPALSLVDSGPPTPTPTLAADVPAVVASLAPVKWRDVLRLPPGPVENVAILNQFHHLARQDGADLEALEWALARGLSQWHTRRGEAEELLSLVPWKELPRTPRVLEPSAGAGALAAAVRRRRRGAHIVAHELDGRRHRALEAVADEVVIGDFLRATMPREPFDLGVANTPYENGLDGLFLAKLMDCCARIAAVTRLNALAGGDRHERVWSRVQAEGWYGRVRVLPKRPGFDGPTSGDNEGAKSDFVLIYLERPEVIGELRGPRRPLVLEWP